MTMMIRSMLTLPSALRLLATTLALSLALQSKTVLAGETTKHNTPSLGCDTENLSEKKLPPAIPFRVLAKYPHRRDAFTQGLQYHDAYLYESTGHYGQSRLSKIDMENGRIVLEKPLEATLFGEGITLLNESLYQLTWKSGTVLRYALSNFALLATHDIAGESWGLTSDGKQLISSDGSATLTWRDPTTLQALTTRTVTYGSRPLRKLNELEWVNNCLLANIWGSTLIAVIDPDSGQVTATLDVKRLLDYERSKGRVDVANGIAHRIVDGELHLLVTGKNWGYIYEILPLH